MSLVTNNFNFYILATAIVLIAAAFDSRPLSADTISQLLDELRSHPENQSARLDARAAEEQARARRRSYPDPELMLSFPRSRMDEQMLFPEPGIQRSEQSGREVRITQPLPFPGRITLQAQSDRRRAEIAQLESRVRQNRLARELLAELLELRSLRQELAIARAFIGRVGVVSQLAESRYAAGRAPLADATRAALRHSALRERIMALEGDIAAAERSIGYYLSKSSLEAIPDNEAIERYFSATALQIERERPMVEERAIAVESSMLLERQRRSERNLAQMEYLPDFALFASYGRMDLRSPYMSIREGREESYAVGVTIRVPLWSALSASSQIESTRHSEESARQNAERFRREVRTEADAISIRLQNNEERLQLYTSTLIPQARRSRDSSRIAYETGRADFVSLLESFDALYEQERSQIVLRRERDLLRLQLLTLLDLFYTNETTAIPAQADRQEQIQ